MYMFEDTIRAACGEIVICCPALVTSSTRLSAIHYYCPSTIGRSLHLIFSFSFLPEWISIAPPRSVVVEQQQASYPASLSYSTTFGQFNVPHISCSPSCRLTNQSSFSPQVTSLIVHRVSKSLTTAVSPLRTMMDHHHPPHPTSTLLPRASYPLSAGKSES